MVFAIFLALIAYTTSKFESVFFMLHIPLVQQNSSYRIKPVFHMNLKLIF